MSLSFSDFIYTQLFLKIPKPSASFSSKIIIVTGANSGIGKETVKHIIALGASKVILACRNMSKGKAAKLEIESSLRCSPDILEVWELDIESYPSIKGFADRVNKLPRLDVLINNAGIYAFNFHAVWGTERSIAVNVIGTFLLSFFLLPKLKETAKTFGVTPHMTFVSSALYSTAKYPEEHGTDVFAWLGDKSHVKMMDQYALSKLFQVFVIYQLGSIVDPTTSGKSSETSGIVINCMDPCMCKGTGLGNEAPVAMRAAGRVFQFLFARTAEEGSRLVVQAASAGRVTHGGYMRSGKLKEYPPMITSEDAVARGKYVWELLGEKLAEIHSGILENVKTV